MCRELAKKRTEFEFLQIVLQHLGFSTDDVTPGEAPDFLLGGAEEGVGVEITELRRPHGSPRDAHWEGACDGVVDLAEREWDKAGKECVHVNVLFDGSVTISNAKRIEVAASLVSIVDAIRPEAGAQAVAGKGPKHLVRHSDCPLGVYSVLVNHCEDGRSIWSAAGGGGEPGHLNQETVQRVLDAKDPKVAKYRESASSSVWLVIGHSHRSSSSSWFYDDGTLDGLSFATNFDRVFVVGASRGEVREIELASTVVRSSTSLDTFESRLR